MNRRLFELDPLDLLFHSFAVLYRELPMWIVLNLLGLLLSLPLITAGAARCGVYFAVQQWILNRIDGGYTIRHAFFDGFRSHFVRGTIVSFLNLICGGLIGFAIWFWLTSPIGPLNYVAVVGIYILLWWLACQPFIFPVCVASKNHTPLGILWLALKLVISTPLYTMLVLLLLIGINMVAIVLLGPVLLVLDVFVAILTTQALWIITDEPLPHLNKQEA